MVQIKQMLVSSRALTYPGTNPCNYIVIHETANTSKGAGAYTHARLQRNGFTASWHYSIDDRDIYQSFPDSVKCWHAGGAHNHNSIGIEICVNSDSDFKKAVQNAAELVKHLMKKHNIPQRNVIQHNVTSSWGKDCPHFLRGGSKGVNWSDFNKMVSGSSVVYTPPKKQTGSSPSTSKWTKKTGNWTGQVLKQGHYGKPVRQLQQKLASKYFYPNKGAKNNGIDSYFGADTKDAVQRFQSMNGLAVDGIAGKKTYAKLGGKSTASKPKPSSKKYPLPNGVYSKAKHGNKKLNAVKQIQRALNAAYFKVGKVDGYYGAKTKDAVSRFQKVHLPREVDGVYGKNTRKALDKKVN